MKLVSLLVLVLVVAAGPARAMPSAVPAAPFPILPTFTLSVEVASGTGTVTSSPAGISCPDTCAAGFAFLSNVTLTATPAAGSSFAAWSGGCSGTSTTCTVTMTASTAVTARFDPVQLAVAVTGAGGLVTSSGQDSPDGIDCGGTCTARYSTGTTVKLWAVAAAGWIFQQWSGACSHGDDVCSVTMDGDKSVAALFTLANGPIGVKANLQIQSTGSGSGTVTSAPGGISCGPTCERYYPVGVKVQLKADPSAGSTFAGWSGGCSGADSACSVFVVPDLAVTARFVSAASVSPGGGGGTAPPPPTDPAPDPPPPPASKGDDSGGAGPAVGNELPAAATALADQQLELRVLRTRQDRRVRVALDLNRPAKAYLSLRRGGRTFARAQRQLAAGTKVLFLRVPRTAARGRYRIVVLLVAGDKTQRLSGTIRA